MKKYFCFWGGVALSAALLFLPAGQAEAKQASRGAAAELAQLVHSQTLPRVTLVWEPVPDAVSYEIELFYGSEYKEKNVFLRQREIYTNGVELLQVPRGREGAGTVHWRVQGLDLDGNPVGEPTPPCSLTAGLFEMNAPLTTGEMEEMDYAPLYPAYAWIPRAGAAKYEVEVLREENGLSRHLRYLYSDSHDVYDEEPLNRGGVYSWRVRALDERERPVSQWSEKRKLEITAPVQVAALGDSITHGGGAASVPPCYRLYAWESYAGVPVKNLGCSGNTTEAMLQRFEADVIPFAPQVLVIMGGVNDFRMGESAKESIHNLKAIRNKCRALGITPVFATATPINPAKMAKVDYIENAAPDWKREQRLLNEWIMKQRFAVDVNEGLTAADGTLKAELTADGLHPDSEGKRLIGEAIGNYLRLKKLAGNEAL